LCCFTLVGKRDERNGDGIAMKNSKSNLLSGALAALLVAWITAPSLCLAQTPDPKGSADSGKASPRPDEPNSSPAADRAAADATSPDPGAVVPTGDRQLRTQVRFPPPILRAASVNLSVTLPSAIASSQSILPASTSRASLVGSSRERTWGWAFNSRQPI
jgi:hypothetical protein